MSFVDAALSHKSILQSRIDNGIDYFAEFVDLLKVSDSTRYEIIFAALLKMSNPPKHVEQVDKSDGYLNIVLDLAKKKIIIKHGNSSRKGRNLVSELFMLVMHLEAEDELMKFKEDRIDML